jgi:hypothetical protein
MLRQKDDETWMRKVKEHLKCNSWDLTWSKMKEVIYKTLEQKENMGFTVMNAASHNGSGE